jgi:Protein of unknown function (DUF726)
MMEKDGQVGDDRPSTPDHAVKSGVEEESDNEGLTTPHSQPGHQNAQEEHEFDDFGLPIPKLVVTSQADSSRSSSFESARSSIDEDIDPSKKHSNISNEDDEADIEDNGTEDADSENLDSAIEWPRVSRSTLPAIGHVKSSPFHTTPPKPTRTMLTSAERAKDLVEIAPVSNSVFKRQESPVTTKSPTSTSPSAKTFPHVDPPKNATPNQVNSTSSEQPPSKDIPKPSEPAAITPPDNVEATAPPEIKEPDVSVDTTSHARKSSEISNEHVSQNLLFDDPDEAYNPSGASQWSHQMAVAQAQAHSPGKTRKSIDNDGWQTMEAYASYDLYDDDGKLVAKEFRPVDDVEDSKGGAGKGYTRMNQDEDAQSADSMDENTQYLFTETLDDENAKTPLSQMQATKELLTEGQRIAYVGLCKLTMVGMLRDVGRVRFKENRAAYESMTLWCQKMMLRLFGHMDISSAGNPPFFSDAEQIMIEQLAEHGVIPADLIPPLMQNVEVANPLLDGSDAGSLKSRQSIASRQSTASRSSSMSSSSPPPIQHPSTLTGKSLSLDLRWTILCDLFLVLIADSVYDSRSRVLLERMGAHLNVDWLDITRFERRVTEALQIQESGEQNWKEDDLLVSRAKQARNRRYMMMGLATLGGGLVIGLSAGLLAPVIGAGLGAAFTTVGIGGTTSFLAGTGGAALITSTGVVTGSAIGGKGMARRTRDVSTFEFRPLHNNQRVNLLVTVSGYTLIVYADIDGWQVRKTTYGFRFRRWIQ